MTQADRVKFVKALLHIIFFLSGIAAVLIGQVLPIMAAHFALTDLQAGYFFPAQFAGSLAGSYATNRFGKRNNYIAASVIGAVAMAAGVLLLNVNSFEVCVAGFFVNGVGIGLTLPAINMMIIEINPERTGPALSILNLCWGVGAIICKPFVDIFSTGGSIGPTTLILAVPMLAASIMLKLAGIPRQGDTKQDDVLPPDDPPIWKTPMAWAIAFFNFIHVGFESGMGG